MLKTIKNIFLRMLITTVFLTSSLSAATFAQIATGAESENGIWLPIISIPEQQQEVFFSKDENVTYNGNPSFSVKNDGRVNWVRKKFDVKKNTIYKASVMAKYDDHYENEIKCPYGSSGAGIWWFQEYTGSEWKKLEWIFNSNDDEEVIVSLSSGDLCGHSLGTAYYSDFKLEEKEMILSTEWNFLCLIYKNADITLPLFKGQQNYHQKKSFDDKDVDDLSYALKQMPNSFEELSDGLMRVSEVDVFVVDKPLTSLGDVDYMSNSSFLCSIDPYEIDDTLYEYMEKGGKEYNQIIVIAPLAEITPDWYGLGGTFFDNIGFAQVSYTSAYDIKSQDFPDRVFVHETLHCLEFSANKTSDVVSLHSHNECGYYEDELKASSSEIKKWFGDYMKNTIKNGATGLPKEVYTVYNSGIYSLVSDNMCGIMDVETLPLSEEEKEKEFKATPTSSKVSLNGEHLEFDSFNIDGYNYFKLRDISSALCDTSKCFSISWIPSYDAISMKATESYENLYLSPKSTEDKTALRTTALLFFNYEQVNFEGYNIDGYNYFKLRDIAEVAGLGIEWNEETNTISIITDLF